MIRGDAAPTLMSLMDTCATGMGSRLLRHVLHHPLTDRTLLRERHTALAALIAMQFLTFTEVAATATLVGVIGEDEAGAIVRDLIERARGVTSGLVTVPTRPTTSRSPISAIVARRSASRARSAGTPGGCRSSMPLQMSARAVENDMVLPGFAPERVCPRAVSDSPGSASSS